MTDELYKGYVIKIEQDEIIDESPREWSNLGVMVCWHRRCSMGDCTVGEAYGKPIKDKPFFPTVQELVNYIKETRAIFLRVYLYEHSGQTVNTRGFSDPWDSGQVGFIYVTKEKVREEFKCKRISKKLKAKVKEILEGEVKIYDQYLRGDIYGYDISLNGEDITDGSCCGFYGYDYCLQEAEDAVDWDLRNRTKEAFEYLMAMPVEAE